MTYTRLYDWTDDRDGGIKIRADRMDAEFDGIFTALNGLIDGTATWTGAIKGYVGTVSLPGYTFDGDLNTGFYRVAADQIGIALAGVQHADFATTGTQLLLKGAPTAGGTADALTVTWGIVPSALASGQRILFKAASANTGAATLNLNSLGAKAVRKISAGTDAALAAGDLAAGNFYEAVYDSTANAAAGGWILITPNGASAASTTSSGIVELATTTEAITGTDTARAVTPDALAALWEAGTENSGGATITMGEGGYFNLITSTTAITAFAFTTDKAGRRAIARFDTARTLTHNATSLILPGGANITTAQGDICQVRSLGSGNFVVDWYTKADGTAVVASSSLAAATQAEQETGSSTTVATTPGRQHFHPSASKAWANLSVAAGTWSNSASYNITSITDNGTADVTLTIATDFSSASWSATATVETTGDRIAYVASLAAGTVSVEIIDLSGTLSESNVQGFSFAGFGDHA